MEQLYFSANNFYINPNYDYTLLLFKLRALACRRRSRKNNLIIHLWTEYNKILCAKQNKYIKGSDFISHQTNSSISVGKYIVVYHNEVTLDIASTLASHRGGVLQNFRFGTQVINGVCHPGTQTN